MANVSAAALRACYPESSSPGESTPVRPGWGEVREGLDIRLGPPGKTRLEAKAAAPLNDSSFMRLELFEQSSSGWAPVAMVGAPRGEFAIDGLPAGEYVLSALLHESSEHSRWSRTPFSLEEERTTNLAVVIPQRQPLSGRLVLEEPRDGLFGAEAKFSVSLEEAALGVEQAGRNASGWFPLADAPNRFELLTIPGAYRIDAGINPPQGYLAEVRFGGLARPDARIEIPHDAAAGELTIVMRFDMGSLDAAVRLPDGWREAATAAGGLLPETVELEVFDNAGRRIQRKRVDPVSGRVEPLALPPGRYQAQARTESQPDSGAPTKGRRFEILSGQTIRVDLDLDADR